MKILAGTSGYAFKEWKGNFYPQDLKDDGMLGFYASKFPAVEINNTFYRLPRENVLRDWAAQVPETFTFALKASQRITHHARLKEESASLVDFLLKNTATLGASNPPVRRRGGRKVSAIATAPRPIPNEATNSQPYPPKAS